MTGTAGGLGMKERSGMAGDYLGYIPSVWQTP